MIISESYPNLKHPRLMHMVSSPTWSFYKSPMCHPEHFSIKEGSLNFSISLVSKAWVVRMFAIALTKTVPIEVYSGMYKFIPLKSLEISYIISLFSLS